MIDFYKKEGKFMDRRPIGIFDSGLGGLTCVKEVMKIMPGEDIIYFGDTGRVPYGARSAEQIVKYVRQDINFLKTFDIKYIIIACGTASSAALPMIRGEYETEITGVLYPASKKALESTKNGRIGVIGTQGTVRSGKYTQQLKEFDPSLKVTEVACPLFVHLVENGHTDSLPAKLIAEEYLEKIKKADVDTLILGCTHYPLLKNIIAEILGDKVRLIDSGAAAAGFAKAEMEEKGLLSDEKTGGTVKYFVSDITESFARLGGMFLNKEITQKVERIDIEKY